MGKNKIKIIFLALLMSQTFAADLKASEIYVKNEALQGETITVEIPAHDISGISGKLDGRELMFNKILRLPNLEEPISRAEFLELIFLNHDFGDVETSRVPDFPDVNEESPYYVYIKKARALNIINGYMDGKFHPFAPITRGQAAKILVEAFDPPPVLEKSVLFADVPDSHRFFNYINDAVGIKWFRGYPDGLMRPDRNINFSEADIVIKRAALPEFFTPLGEKPYYKAYAGINRLVAPGIKTLEVTISSPFYDTENRQVGINVLQRPVPVVKFSLPKEKTDLFADDAQEKTWNAIYASMANPSNIQLWEGEFRIPTSGEITLGFGDKLYINGAYSGSHFGIDYANKGGTEIYAANSGKIVLAEYTPSFGNTVVIDHGLNIFTMYLHMSELKTTENDNVKKGDLIGLMGSTGISSGDHLHYTHFIGDVIVDPDQWILDPP